MDFISLSVGCDVVSLRHQSDVEPKSTSHMSPLFVSYVDPISLLGCDMCHSMMSQCVTLDPHHVSASGTCPTI
jgi:hypothetical protein